ncbi:bacterial proteasome activator family protein [Janibacter sp. G56]|uniref:bacterial proteasome activator family protein n=1 Tax=Janibacter sp. G56 TaxID=3418717 RepID=UPI003CFF7252
MSDEQEQQPTQEQPTAESTAPTAGHDDGEVSRVVVVTPEGMGVASGGDAADLIEHPAKVMRIGSMIKQLLEEVRSAPLDEAGRARLAEIHSRSIAELKDGLADELVEELDRLALPFTDAHPSDAELRIAQAQLVGWLEGLFHGIQAALVAQQVATKMQLQQMRALPSGPLPHPSAGPATDPTPASEGGQPGQPGFPPAHEGTGQYL